jgi:hypothetical protein
MPGCTASARAMPIRCRALHLRAHVVVKTGGVGQAVPQGTLADDARDAQPRIQACERVLEHHLDAQSCRQRLFSRHLIAPLAVDTHFA